MVEKMLDGIETRLGVDFLKNRDSFRKIADKIIYTGPIDEFYDYCFGMLEYKSLRFENEVINSNNYQGNAVINYTESHVPYTRIIEHKHFDPIETNHTVITREYPCEWKKGDEPYYPVNDNLNMELFKKYKQLANSENNIIFGGRLGEYKYYDMHQVIKSALNLMVKLDK